MNPELLTEFSRRSRFFAVAGITIGSLLIVGGAFCYAYFLFNTNTKLTPNELQAGSLLASGLILVLACCSPWMQDSIAREKMETALARQSKEYAKEIVSLRKRINMNELDANSSDRSDLSDLLKKFFRKWDRYGFNIPRIINWGGRREEFEKFRNTSKAELQEALNLLVADGVVRTRLSKNGNVLYQHNAEQQSD